MLQKAEGAPAEDLGFVEDAAPVSEFQSELMPADTVASEGEEAIADGDSIAAAEPVFEVEPKVVAETVADAEPIAAAEPVADVEPVAEVEPVADVEPTEDEVLVADADPAVDTEPISAAEHVADLGSVADVEPVAEAEPVADVAPKEDEELVADAEPVAEPEAIPVSAPEEAFVAPEKLGFNPEAAPAEEDEVSAAASEEEEDISVAAPEEDAIPVAVPESEAPQVEEPVFIPASSPDLEEKKKGILSKSERSKNGKQQKAVEQPNTIPKAMPTKILPVTGSLLSSHLKLVDMKKKPEFRVYLEEDILVPDVKPDLAQILSMDGRVSLSEREIHTGQSEVDKIRIVGELGLKTLYRPEDLVNGEPVVAIESKLPFKNEIDISGDAYSDLTITPVLESIDFTVINERKFKAKATILLNFREYSSLDVEVFEGIKDEEVQMLKENIRLTDVALRKTESTEIKEEFSLKENMPEIAQILDYEVHVSENHKQITKEKAVINSSIYCNVIYLGKAEESDVDKADFEENYQTLHLYQGRAEFTQFIKFDGENLGSQNPAGSKVNFNISSLSLNPKEDENGKASILELDLTVDTGLELYKNVEKEVVTDVYHHLKNVQYDTQNVQLMSLRGSGVSETSVREIINIPQKYSGVEKIAYISGFITEKPGRVEEGKNIVEGNVSINLICIAADDEKTLFNIKQDIPFRSAMEIPGISADMTADNDISLKELWFDKINNRQVEVNAGILVNSTVSKREEHKLVKSVSFVEGTEEQVRNPGIILYIARAGDSIWKIAKRFRTTTDEIMKVNDLVSTKDLKPGSKLIIVAKNH